MSYRTLTVERSTSTAHRLHHYGGVCGNVHGHNMDWEVEVWVDMDGVGDDNMPVDFKDVSDTIDQVDHALLLNVEDPLLDVVEEELVVGSGTENIDELRELDQDGIFAEGGTIPVLGEVYLFWGDPTCELMSNWMGHRIYDINKHIKAVDVTVWETDKYGIKSSPIPEPAAQANIDGVD